MSRTSRHAFIMAKVYGIISRSFIGENYRDLLRLKSLSELSERLFPGGPAQPAPKPLRLPIELEERIVRSSIAAMTYVLDYFQDPPPILVHAARKLEYQNVKSVVRGIVNGQLENLRLWDLGAYAAVRLAGAKDMRKTIHASPYSWILPLLETEPLSLVENRLDREYYARFMQLARALPARDRVGVVRLGAAEIALASVIWALRLRFFFRMDAVQAGALLVGGTSGSVRAAIEEAFEIPVDSADGWRKWRYGWLLEDQLSDSFTAPDPIRAEQRASRALYARAHAALHQNPFTLGPLVAYFKLKEYEASLLGVAVEALNLSMPEQDVLDIVGIR
jgi:vacuolar-type H+-ATPase subunit C/Vma6